MRIFNHTVQGQSHKDRGNIPCQDSSYCLSEDGMWIAVVSDGHGGNRYIRSKIGSKLAVDVATEKIKEFVKTADSTLFSSEPFTQRGADGDKSYNPTQSETSLGQKVRHLAESIIGKWYSEIEKHATENPLSEEEIRHITEDIKKPEYIDLFEKKVSIEKNYGCTLIACLITNDYWLAFQIGDGRVVAIDNSEKTAYNPILDDSRCLGNITTSLCGENPCNDIRYCYGGKETIPVIVFLGSDGMDAYEENLTYIYVSLAYELTKSTDFESFRKDLEKDVEVISTRGVKDDTTLAFIADEDKLKGALPNIIRYIIDWKQNLKTARISERDYTSKNIDEYLLKVNKDIEKDEEIIRNLSAQKQKIEEEVRSIKGKLDESEIELKQNEHEDVQSLFSELKIKFGKCMFSVFMLSYETELEKEKGTVSNLKKQLEKNQSDIVSLDEQISKAEKSLTPKREGRDNALKKKERVESECQTVCDRIDGELEKLQEELKSLSQTNTECQDYTECQNEPSESDKVDDVPQSNDVEAQSEVHSDLSSEPSTIEDENKNFD